MEQDESPLVVARDGVPDEKHAPETVGGLHVALPDGS